MSGSFAMARSHTPMSSPEERLRRVGRICLAFQVMVIAFSIAIIVGTSKASTVVIVLVFDVVYTGYNFALWRRVKAQTAARQGQGSTS